jgi:hypothetical protein
VLILINQKKYKAMKNRMLVAVLMLVGIVNYSIAQSTYAFRVLANKGANEVKTGDSWQPLRTGASLKEGDEIKLGENSYVGLIHSSGKPKELKKAGPYKIKDLASTMTGGASVLNKYADFILSSNSAEAKKNRLSATGAVHRAGSMEDIIVYLPENQHSSIYNSTAVVNWESKSGNRGPFVVTVQNMFGDDMIVRETPEASYTLDLNDPKLVNEQHFLVQVRNKNDAKLLSAQHLIKKVQTAEQQKIKEQLSQFIGEMTEETALNKFIMAGFYEDNQLFIDAITAYEEAIRMAPEVETYKEAYEEFLLRNRLKIPKP